MSKFVTDSNGNSRGQYAVDTQFDRISSDQVASGEGSSILAGIANKVSGNYSTVVGGQENLVTGDFNLVGGTLNITSGTGSLVYGNNNELDSAYSWIIGSNNNLANDYVYVFGKNGNWFNGGNDDATKITVLACESYNIGTPVANENAQPIGAVLLGGVFPFAIFSQEVIKNAYAYSTDFPKPYAYTSVQVQESKVLLTAEETISTTPSITVANMRLQLEGNILGLPDLGTNLSMLFNGMYWAVTVNWIVKDMTPTLAVSRPVRAGSDMLVVKRDQSGNMTLLKQTLSNFGSSGLSNITSAYSFGSSPYSIQMQIRMTSPTPMTKKLRAAASANFVQSLSFLN
jgi:hypothetical protein